MKILKVQKLYDELVEEMENGCTDWEYEEAWIEAAQDSEEEMEMLLKLFFKTDDAYYKWRLGNTLVRLNRKEIIPELRRCLDNKDEEVQFDMAWCLVGLGDEVGGQKFIELATKPENICKIQSFICELREEIPGEYAQELADKLEAMQFSSNKKIDA